MYTEYTLLWTSSVRQKARGRTLRRQMHDTSQHPQQHQQQQQPARCQHIEHVFGNIRKPTMLHMDIHTNIQRPVPPPKFSIHKQYSHQHNNPQLGINQISIRIVQIISQLNSKRPPSPVHLLRVGHCVFRTFFVVILPLLASTSVPHPVPA